MAYPNIPQCITIANLLTIPFGLIAVPVLDHIRNRMGYSDRWWYWMIAVCCIAFWVGVWGSLLLNAPYF